MNQVVEGEVITAKPTPKLPKLRTIRDCRKELALVYYDARRGAIAAQDATRLAYLLIGLANMIRDHELEARIQKLEETAK